MPAAAQDARKGVLFDEFPPVLQLQLKRFEYDFQRDVMVKVGNPYIYMGQQWPIADKDRRHTLGRC